MNMCPYLMFRDQQCEVAFEFYQRVLGGEIVAMMKARGSPMEQHCPPDQLDNVMHARLKIGSQLLMGADAPVERYKPIEGFTVTLEPKTAAESERIYKQLSEGGTIEMELQPTFWTTRFGMFRDRYGTPWMISCEEQPA
jgi:PhnB protein